jgi:hypothetical protein
VWENESLLLLDPPAEFFFLFARVSCFLLLKHTRWIEKWPVYQQECATRSRYFTLPEESYPQAVVLFAKEKSLTIFSKVG